MTPPRGLPEPPPRRAGSADAPARTELWAPRTGSGCAALVLLGMLPVMLPMALWPGAPGPLRAFGWLGTAVTLWGLLQLLRPDPLATTPWAVADADGIRFGEIGRHFAWRDVSRVILDRAGDFATLYVYLGDAPVISDDNPVRVPLTLPPGRYPELIALLERGLGPGRVQVM